MGTSYYTSLAWSDDEGQTWTEVPQTDYKLGSGYSLPYLLPEEQIYGIIYDGPAHDKKYVVTTMRCNVFWSRDGKKWTKERNVLHGDDYGMSDMPNPLYHLVYGEPDKAQGGRYLVTGNNGKFAWSDDATNWKDGKIDGINVKILEHLWFGHALIDGDPSRIFVIHFFADYDSTSPSDETHYSFYFYSKDGVNWGNPLTPEQFAVLNFTPRFSTGGDTSATPDNVDLKDLEFAPMPTDPDDSTYRKHVSFFAKGNNKLFAFGKGTRMAVSHAGAYD
jgi:hypothetical protein